MSLLPLESNPDVMNKFMHLLGVPSRWNIVDVYGLDGEALAWVPQPVVALILLYPCSDKFYKYSEEENARIKDKGQVLDPDLFYMKQLVSNACGTVALIHCVANNSERLELSDGPFKKSLEDVKALSPEEKGDKLLKAMDTDSLNLIEAHQELSLEGQTEANPDEQVNHHFIALIEKNGNLYELDGRKEFPINHGSTTKESFLQDAAKICQDFIQRDSEDVNFTVMALAASEN